MAFNPSNWYWVVGGDTTQVYSSAVGNYVPVADAGYQIWLTQKNEKNVLNLPTQIDTEANLGTVLADYLLRPTPANILDGYTDAQATQVIAQVVFKVLFNHENRIRTIERTLSLNGSPPNLTPSQAKAAVKSLM